MKPLVVWAGPVDSSQVPGATVEGAAEDFLSCRGDQGNWVWCPGLGEALRSSPAALIAHADAPADTDDLFFGAFSAGGSVVKRLLEEADYRAMTSAVHLADATYTSSWADASTHTPPAIEGFVRYAVDVATGPGDKLFIATASPNPNGKWASGRENLRAIEAEVERRTGLSFVERPDLLNIGPPADRVSQLGNVLFGYYPPSPLGHQGHVTIAGPIWEEVIQPWLDKGRGPVDAAGSLPTSPPLPTLPPPPVPGLPPLPPGVVKPLAVVAASAAGMLGGYLLGRFIFRGV